MVSPSDPHLFLPFVYRTSTLGRDWGQLTEGSKEAPVRWRSQRKQQYLSSWQPSSCSPTYRCRRSPILVPLGSLQAVLPCIVDDGLQYDGHSLSVCHLFNFF